MPPFRGKDPQIFYNASDMKNNNKFGFYTLELTRKYISIGSFASICRKPPFGGSITKDGGKGQCTQNPSYMIISFVTDVVAIGYMAVCMFPPVQSVGPFLGAPSRKRPLIRLNNIEIRNLRPQIGIKHLVPFTPSLGGDTPPSTTGLLKIKFANSNPVLALRQPGNITSLLTKAKFNSNTITRIPPTPGIVSTLSTKV